MTTFDPATGLATGTFGFGTFQHGDDAPFPALVLPGGTVGDLSDLYPDTLAIFEDWDRAFDQMARRADEPAGQRYSFETVKALPVVARPNLLCTGANYRTHVAEMMTHNDMYRHLRKPGESDESFFSRNLAAVDRRAREGMPFIWVGLHSALAGANDDIPLPVVGGQADWELELGIYVKKPGRNLSLDEADDLIAAYVMVNDLGLADTARRTDVQFEWDFLGKSSPGFFPCGPFAVPKEFVDLAQARIQLSVNGTRRQDWPVDDMIFGPKQLLTYASERVGLRSGDLLIAGSPPGNAASHGRIWLSEGDVIESEITYLGRQRNEVVKEASNGRKPVFGPTITTGSYGV
ncbi:fumarylacetoacetate hydrolase family protein [Nocardia aobensis]|uniref:Fumarylacetoacetate hydrolase family protein n=1 Tax=Nocardia aobensis TaxID=257277 RepID=A0ABW6PF70_9NOCA